MRIIDLYKLREIAGETIVVSQGKTNVNMTRIISLNASAKLLYERLSDKDFNIEDAARILAETYGISDEQALKDASAWIESLKKCSVIE